MEPSAVEIWGMLLLRVVEPNSGFAEEKKHTSVSGGCRIFAWRALLQVIVEAQ